LSKLEVTVVGSAKRSRRETIGEEKNSHARSPSVPAGMMTGLPSSGPSSLESILNRRSLSRKKAIFPSAVVTEYAPRE